MKKTKIVGIVINVILLILNISGVIYKYNMAYNNYSPYSLPESFWDIMTIVHVLVIFITVISLYIFFTKKEISTLIYWELVLIFAPLGISFYSYYGLSHIVEYFFVIFCFLTALLGIYKLVRS